MAVLRRAKREVYRVYSEEEFLSPTHTPTDWSVSPAEGAPRERPLRRLAGIAALTGAVGTVVGAIALAGVGSRSAGLRVTASAAPRPAAARPTSAPVAGAHRNRSPRAGRGAHPHDVHGRAARSVSGHRPAGYRPARRRRDIDSLARRTQLPSGTAVTAERESVASAQASAQATARAPVRSEFGFER
jgi:hypothetical protein